MRTNPLVIDAGLAVLAALLLIVIAPGLAVVGIVALLVLAVCAVSYGRERRRRSRREHIGVQRRRR